MADTIDFSIEQASAPRPWRLGKGDKAGFILDADGNCIARVSTTSAVPDPNSIAIASLIVAAVNTAVTIPKS